MAPFACGPSMQIQEDPASLDWAFPSGAEALRHCLSHPNCSGTTSTPSCAFCHLRSCPPDIHFPTTAPPASLSTGDPPPPPTPGKPPLQHPGTTLEVADSVDPTDCCPQRQQLKTSRLLPASAYHQDKLVCIYILPAKLQ